MAISHANFAYHFRNGASLLCMIPKFSDKCVVHMSKKSSRTPPLMVVMFGASEIHKFLTHKCIVYMKSF